MRIGTSRFLMKRKTNNYILMKSCSFISSMFLVVLYLTMQYSGNNEVLISFRFKNNYLLNEAIKLITPVNICRLLIVAEVLSVIYIIYFFKVRPRIKRKNNYLRLKIKGNIIQDRSSTTSYLLANVLPIITLELDRGYKIIFFILLILILGYMYIKNNLFYINPLYDLLNIKIYSGVLETVNERSTPREINKVIISTVNLYEFKDRIYIGIEGVDNIIINKIM